MPRSLAQRIPRYFKQLAARYGNPPARRDGRAHDWLWFSKKVLKEEQVAKK
jgi:hypothetical protein